jgi:acetyl esterase/lipase
MKPPLAVFSILAGLLLLAPVCQTGEKPKEKGKVADPTTVIHKLWPDDPAKPGNRAPGARGTAYEDIPGVFLYQPKNPSGTAIVVCPGGGYGGLAMDHEGKQIGQWLNSHNITGVILKYRLGSRYNHPIPLTDAQRAVRYVRANADKLKIDPKRVGILGFSAGGHLASTAATHFDAGDKDAADPIDRQSCRPDFAVLLYPVITLEGPFAHVGSRNNLLGKSPEPKLVDSLCNDRQVTKDTPPTMLVHTSEDSGVRPENSVLFFLALKKNGVPAELHIYEKGRHGLGLGEKGTPFASWPDRCIDWMKGRGMLDAGK